MSEMLQKEPNTFFSYHGWSGKITPIEKFTTLKLKCLYVSVDVLGTGLSCMWITRSSICEVLNTISDK